MRGVVRWISGLLAQTVETNGQAAARLHISAGNVRIEQHRCTVVSAIG